MLRPSSCIRRDTKREEKSLFFSSLIYLAKTSVPLIILGCEVRFNNSYCSPCQPLCFPWSPHFPFPSVTPNLLPFGNISSIRHLNWAPSGSSLSFHSVVAGVCVFYGHEQLLCLPWWILRLDWLPAADEMFTQSMNRAKWDTWTY